MKLLKRITVLTVVLSMILSCVQIMPYAAGLTGTDKAVVELVPMKLTQTAIDNGTKVAKLTNSDFEEVSKSDLSLSEGNTFYIGAKLTDFDNISDMSNGLTALAFGFTYDTTYLSLEATAANESKYIVTRMGTEDTEGNEIIIEADAAGNTYADNSSSVDAGSVYVSLIFSNASSAGCFKGTTDKILTAIGFTLKSTPPDGTKLFSFPCNTENASWYALTTGYSGDNNEVKYQLSKDGTVGDSGGDIETVIEYDTSAVDFFPAAVSYTSISSTGTLATQYVGKALNTTGITISGSDSTNSTTITSGITYKYADSSSITSADSAELSAVPSTLTTNENGKYLYAIYNGLICQVGQLSVTTDSVTAVALKGTFTLGTYTAGQTIDLSNANFTLTMASGDTKDVTYSELATYGGVAYIADSATAEHDSSSSTFTSGTTQLSSSDNGKYLNVQVNGRVVSLGTLTVSGPSVSSVTIAKKDGATFTYGDSYATFKNQFTVTAAYSDNSSADVASDATYYYMVNGTETIITDTTVLPAGDYNIYASYSNKKSANPVSITVNKANVTVPTSDPFLADPKKTYDGNATETVTKTITDGVLSGDTVTVTATYTYAAKTAGSSLTKVEYALDETSAANYSLNTANGACPDADTAATIAQKELTVNSFNIELKVDASGSATDKTLVLNSENSTGLVEGDTVSLKYSYSGADTSAEREAAAALTIDNATLEGTDAANYKLSATPTATYTVLAKEYTAVEGAAIAAITYGDNLDLSNYAVTLKSTDGDDTITGYDNFAAKGITVTLDGTALTSATVSGLKAGDHTLTVKYGNYTSDVKVTVNKKAVTIATPNTFATLPSKTYNGENTTTQTQAADNALTADGTVTITATYTYDSAAAGAALKSIAYTVDNDNYEVVSGDNTDFPTDVTGAPAIAKKTLHITAVSDIPSITAKSDAEDPIVCEVTGSEKYTAPAVDIVSGDTVKVSYKVTYAADDTLKAGTPTVTLSDFTIDNANYELDKASLPTTAIGEVTEAAVKEVGSISLDPKMSTSGDGYIADISGITAPVTYGDGSTKELSLSDLKGEGFTVTVKDKDGNDVTLNDDGTFTADPKGEYTITVSKGDGDNAVSGTASLTLPDVPKAPTVSVDKGTNTIVIDTPQGSDGTDIDWSGVEYYIAPATQTTIPDDATWTSFADTDDKTFADLDPNTSYVVYVRIPATNDTIASPVIASESVTTYKNKVTVMKASSETVVATVYVDDLTDLADYAAFASATGITASGYKKTLYTDSTAKTEVTYPLSITGDTTLYMKKNSNNGGGGGGGGSDVTVKFDKSELSGNVGDTLKITATVAGSTSTPTWTSSNEKVATVDENGNVTLVGEGTATITAKIGSLASKTATVTVKEADATATEKPQATEEPSDNTDKPLIDKEYTKPYAKGYEDGTFRPDASLTRAELASMIARVIYGDDIPDGVYSATFTDVAADAWYNKYIGYLESYNVLTGYEDGSFLPEDIVTRSEMCAVIARAQKLELVSYNGEFGDVTDSDWAKDYIETLYSNGIIEGYSGDEFKPYGLLSRAEAVTIINRLLAPSTVVDSPSYSDVSGHWAADEITFATSEREVNAALVTQEPVVTEEPAAAEEATEEPEATEEVTEEATASPEASAEAEATASPEA